MTVAFDVSSTKAETTGDSTWSHLAAASGVKGILVYIVIRNSNTPPVGVTYGAVTMLKIGEANDTLGEPGNTTAWFIGDAVLQGTQTVSVDVGVAQVWGGVAISVTGADNMDPYVNTVQEQAANPSPTMSVPVGFVSYPTAGMYSGLAAPTSITAGSGYTTFGGVDFSGGGVSDCAQFERLTSGTVTGTPTIDMTSASDDCAYIAVAIGERGPNAPALIAGGAASILTVSLDGKSWTQRVVNPTRSENIPGSCWSPELGLFVITTFATSSGLDGIITSSDGATWTVRASNVTSVLINAVEWSPAAHRFVACVNGGPDTFQTSTTGISGWTTSGSVFGGDTAQGVAWSPELSLFVTVGGVGRLATAPDGLNWALRTSQFGATNIFGVAWSPSLSLFVTVGGAGKLATSPDGTTWTLQTSQFGATTINSVAWSPTLALFVAVGEAGTLTTSPDGINWTLRTSGFGSNAIFTVAARTFTNTEYRPVISRPGVNLRGARMGPPILIRQRNGEAVVVVIGTTVFIIDTSPTA